MNKLNNSNFSSEDDLITVCRIVCICTETSELQFNIAEEKIEEREFKPPDSEIILNYTNRGQSLRELHARCLQYFATYENPYIHIHR